MDVAVKELVIRVDAVRGTVSIYLSLSPRPTLSHASAADLFKLIEVPSTHLLVKDESISEARLGALILSALDLDHSDSPNASTLIHDSPAIERGHGLIEARAKSGDPVAQHALAVMYLAESLRLRNTDLLNQADQWLRVASKNGSAEATEFLANEWADVRTRYGERIDKLKR